MLIEKFSTSLLPKSNSAHLRWIPKARARNSPSLCCVVLRAPRKPNFRERYRKYLEKCSTQNFANISSERHRHESTPPPITERRVKIEQKLASSYSKIPFNRFCRCTDFQRQQKSKQLKKLSHEDIFLSIFFLPPFGFSPFVLPRVRKHLRHSLFFHTNGKRFKISGYLLLYLYTFHSENISEL